MVIANMVSLIILIIGGLNWALAGLAKIDVINVIFSRSVVAMILYGVIGLAALWMIVALIMTRGNLTTSTEDTTTRARATTK